MIFIYSDCEIFLGLENGDVKVSDISVMSIYIVFNEDYFLIFGRFNNKVFN